MTCQYCQAQMSVGQRFCGECGKMQPEKESVTHDLDSTLKFKLTPGTCPKCEQIDSVQKISSLIAGGTSNTAGFAFGPSGSERSITSFALQSQSVLAGRFNSPRIPSASLGAHIFLGTAICFIPLLIYIYIHGQISKDGVAGLFVLALFGTFGLFIALIPGVIIGIISSRRATSQMTAERQKWAERQQLLRNAYYCLRDDLAFNAEIQGTPEEFVNIIFSN